MKKTICILLLSTIIFTIIACDNSINWQINVGDEVIVIMLDDTEHKGTVREKQEFGRRDTIVIEQENGIKRTIQAKLIKEILIL